MQDLVAYIPVLNRQYCDWLKRHDPFRLHLIPQRVAESLLPRLARNLMALSESEISTMVKWVVGREVFVFNPSNIPLQTRFIMPDEDICRLVAEKYFYPTSFCKEVVFEKIWARWDMTAVKRQEPIIPDMEVCPDEVDVAMIMLADKSAEDSPDWWRQVGAVAFNDRGLLGHACNEHFPTEYEVAIFGDPRLNFDAGDSAGENVYLSLHAEKMVIASCARRGISLEGASLIVTTFPCSDCARWIAVAGIKKLFFFEGYSVLKGFETLKAAGVRIVRVKVPGFA